MELALRTTGLKKRFGRNKPWVLDDLSLEFPKGAICGLVGPNGAGKTTLFSVVAGFLHCDSGQVDILGGGPFDPFRLKGRFGILPQDAHLDLGVTPRGFLRGLGRLQGLGSSEVGREVDAMLEAVNLKQHATKRVGTLSHGMRRRLTVASALLGRPELVLLDEPMAGLDPLEASRLRDLILELRGESTVIVSSHNLAELERISDHVVLMETGRCVGAGSVDALTAQGQEATWLLGEGEVPLERLSKLLPGDTFILDGRELTHRAANEAALDEGSIVIAAEMVRVGIPVRGLRRGVTLEESYLSRK